MSADCHIHMVLDGVDWKSAIARHKAGPDIAFIRRQLAAYREQGFTYLRDGGDRWGVGAAAREIAGEYGITYRTPLSPLVMEGHYGSFIGKTYADLKQHAALVREQKAQGADFIKIMISGLMDFNEFGKLTLPSLPGKQIRELIHIAHDMGMAVMAHANGPEAVIAAAEAGVDSVEHGAYLNKESLSAMAENGVVWVPTLSTVANLRGTGRFPEIQIQKILEFNSENVAVFHAMGGLIAPGSDAGAWAVPHGADREYSLLRELGVDDNALDRGAKMIREKFKQEVTV